MENMIEVNITEDDVYTKNSLKRIAASLILASYFDATGQSSYLRRIKSPMKVSEEIKTAKKWFLEDNNSDILWSFGWCCKVLGISCQIVRDKVFGHVAEE